MAGRAVGLRGIREESGERHSPFALALYEALQAKATLIPKGQGDGVITATELYLYLREQVEVGVEEEVGHEQTPGLWPLKKHDKGEYIFLVPDHELNLPPAPDLTLDLNPWRGLKSYDQKHSQLFFGRDQEIEELSQLVNEHPFIAVLGASGTGKSSLVKAGVLSAVERQEIRRRRNRNLVPMLSCHPSAPRTTLFERWRCYCMPNYQNWSPSSLAATLPWPKSSVAGPKNTRINAWCCTIDQFEELVTLCREDERERFLDLLSTAVELQPDAFRLIITLRSDFEPLFVDTRFSGVTSCRRNTPIFVMSSPP